MWVQINQYKIDKCISLHMWVQIDQNKIVCVSLHMWVQIDQYKILIKCMCVSTCGYKLINLKVNLRQR